MDPDEVLKIARAAVAEWHAAPDGSMEEKNAAERLVFAFGDLDNWITGGGFMPRGWPERPKSFLASQVADPVDRQEV